MRKYLVTIGNDDISQYGKQFKKEFIVKGYKKAKTIINDVIKYQKYTGEYAGMKLIKNKKGL